MEKIMACRICLATDVRLYEMCRYQLITAYENLTGYKVLDSNLHHVCSYCGTMIRKCTTFKEKCIRSQQVLEALVKEHTLVTTRHVETINRSLRSLTLPYTIQHIQNNDSTEVSFNTTVTSENIDTTNTSTFSNHSITIKDEDCHIKSDTEEYNDDSCNYNNDVEIKQEFHYNNHVYVGRNDNEQKNDSDEEPLVKKVKKKKKTKVKVPNHSLKLNNVITHIKTEDPQSLYFNQSFSVQKQNLRTNDENSQTNDENLSTNDENLPTNDENVTNEVLDLEIDHKLVILSKQEQIEEVLSRKTSANYLNSVHKCESCYKGFMTEATYKNHMARHDPCSGPVACPACSTRWADARALRAHTLISHERRYICKLCGHTSKSCHKAKEHAQWHAGVTFPCAKCGRTFTKSTSYLTHVRLRHATHVCTTCGHSFIGENGLSMHVKKAHKNHDGVSTHGCPQCGVHFRSSAALEHHRDLTEGACAHTHHTCAQCGDHFATDQLLKEHTDMHLRTDALRTCSQCSRTFANERSLSAHVQRTHARGHARAPRHCVCEVCGYKCMSASSLVNHQRLHSGEKPHACAHCHKRFSVAQRLQIHLRTHTGERPFQCTRCPKAFKHKAALNRHDRVHTGVKPYSCPQCGKRFSQSNSMKQHCAGVHMKTRIYATRNKQ